MYSVVKDGKVEIHGGKSDALNVLLLISREGEEKKERRLSTTIVNLSNVLSTVHTPSISHSLQALNSRALVQLTGN